MNKNNFEKLKEVSLKLIHPTDNGYHKKLILKTFKLPNGEIETFTIDRGKDSVGIVCITKSAEVILVQQFRPGSEELDFEIPGGSINNGESPLFAGVRELAEEVGYRGDAIYIGSVPYSPYSTGSRHCILVINAEKTEKQNLDPNEFLSIVKMDLKTFRHKIKKMKIRGWDFGFRCLDYLGKL